MQHIPFLKHVADDLRKRIGNDLSRTIVVFPNKRAGLFLNDYLLPEDGRPMWAPRYKAVNEFIQDLSQRQIADPIETICRLYKHYQVQTGSTETLDQFYCWGERLLADFDDLDKSMAPADKLFNSLQEYEEISADAELDSDEIEQFKRFAGGLKEGEDTKVRSSFLRLWKALPNIYKGLRKELETEGIAYEGQMYREVAEKMEAGEISLPKDIEHVVVVGLNVLNKVERSVFKTLQKENKAIFYWDYDTYYANTGGHSTNEAGKFIERDLKEFPNALENEADCFNNFLKDRNGARTINFIEAPTEAAQAESVARWLSNPRNFNPEKPRETAIVLCNEALLQPVLHALPDRVSEVNVTKGFPLGHTPAYASFIKEAEVRAADKALQGKDFISKLQEFTVKESTQVTSSEEGDDFLQMLYTESYYKVYTTLARFANLIEKGLLNVTPVTLFRLLRQTLSQMSIPFHGEPATGLQVMGVLETRCLDFRHVLMLSVGEGFLPQKASDNSFIPYLIRKHYGLTTAEHKTSVYAYYFYRLLQRAEHACLEYNSSTDGLRKGEMSRFMLSMLLEGKVPISRYRLSSTPHPEPRAMTEAWKSADFAERVMKEVSPSKINTYMRCQMLFYFKYVLGIPEQTAEDAVIAPNDFGTLLHKAAELFYGDVQAKTSAPIKPNNLKKYNNDVTLSHYVGQAFKEVDIERTPLVEKAVLRYLKLIVRFEAGANAGQKLPAEEFEVKEREFTTSRTFNVPFGNDTFPVCLKGNIDRLDVATIDGTPHLRIVDYKTGGNMEDVKEMDDLFIAGKDHPHYAFQTFLYALTLEDKTQLPIAPSLYYAAKTVSKDYTPYIKYDNEPMLDFREIAPKFKEKFINLLCQMLNPALPLERTEDLHTCSNCAFAQICGRA